MTYVIDESRGDGRAHTHSLRVTINVFFLTKNSNWNEWFLASSEVNFGFKRQFIVFSTCENVDGNFESLGGRFHRNGRIRPIGRLGVTFLIGRLGVKLNTFELSENVKNGQRSISLNKRADSCKWSCKTPAKKVPVVKSWAVDLNLDENRAAHNTLSYDQRDLITRRGGKFKLTVTVESGVQGG